MSPPSNTRPITRLFGLKQNTAAQPRPSATLLLLREVAGAGVEVLLVARHPDTPFGDLYAFPGGVMATTDEELIALCQGMSARQANDQLKLSSGALGFWVTAIRETFEETGILLASNVNGDQVDPTAATELRRQLSTGVSFNTLCLQSGLKFPIDRMFYTSHWITPERRSDRFDTRFFVTEWPEGQRVTLDETELTDSRWCSARVALSDIADGTIRVAPPTLAHLKELAEHESLSSALNWSRRQVTEGIKPVLPVIQGEGREQRVLLPDHPDYPRPPR